MIFMAFLKVIFTLLLCVPFVYLLIYLLAKMIDEVLKQTKKTGRKKNNPDRRRI